MDLCMDFQVTNQQHTSVYDQVEQHLAEFFYVARESLGCRQNLLVILGVVKV